VGAPEQESQETEGVALETSTVRLTEVHTDVGRDDAQSRDAISRQKAPGRPGNDPGEGLDEGGHRGSPLPLKRPERVSAVHDDVGEGSGRSEEGRAASALGVSAQGVEELGTRVTPGEVTGALVESSVERASACESETEGGGRNLPEAGEMSEDEMDTPART
jgi:hypothetical protein